jgi:hypothetical protein
MAFIPAPPFPKSRGDIIRSTDWNDAINELLRLDTAKVNRAGDAMTGPLTITGNVGIGTTSPDRSLTVANTTGANYLNVKDGTREILMGVDATGGIVSVMTSHDLVLRAGANSEKMRLTASGNVGIGTATPAARLTVQTPINYSGDTLRAESKAEPGNYYLNLNTVVTSGVVRWVFNQFNAGTNYPGVLAFDRGNVGIGTATPASLLDVNGDISFEKRAGGAARVLPAGGTVVWNDGTWLRLNQNLDYTKPIFGVHTPGVLAPVSLNVGGLGNWGDPGAGNAWIAGTVGIGTNSPQVKLHVVGNRIRLDGGGAKVLDMRADGSALDLESNTDLYLNNNNIQIWYRKLNPVSSRELKENIRTFSGEDALKCLTEVEAVMFNYRDDARKDVCLGFISEDTPDLLATPDRKGVIPMHFITVLTRVAQEQQKTIHSMQREIETLNHQIKSSGSRKGKLA